MKNFNQSFLSSGKFTLSLLVIAILVSFAAAQSNDESLPRASTMKSQAASFSAVVEFEKSRLRSDSTLSLQSDSSKARTENIVYQRTSHSSYNDSPVDIFFVDKDQYEVDTELNKIVQFGPRPRTIDDPEPTALDFKQNCRPKQLRQMAYNFASQYSSLPLSNLSESVTDKEGVVYFFRWETNTKKFDGLPAFLQIGLSCSGDLLSYTNTLDLKEKLLLKQRFPTEALSVSVGGVYIFANNGSNYQQYGPSRYWWTTNNEGYADQGHTGKMISESCGDHLHHQLMSINDVNPTTPNSQSIKINYADAVNPLRYYGSYTSALTEIISCNVIVDYALYATPTAVTLYRGSTAYFDVYAYTNAGFRGTVNWYAINLPGDRFLLGTGFYPGSVNVQANGTYYGSRLKVVTDGGTPTGNFTITIEGRSGNKVARTYVSVKIL